MVLCRWTLVSIPIFDGETETMELQEALAKIKELEESNTKLEADKKAALGEKFKASQAAKEAQDAIEEAEREAATKAGDIEKIKSQLETKHKKELDSLRAELDTANSSLKTIRVDNAIAQAIAKSNVITDHVDAVESLIHRRVQYENGEATIDGKSIEDWSKDYFSKSGAIYVRAPENSGGNIMGNDGTNSTSLGDWTRDNFASREAEWLSIDKKDPQLAKAIAQKVGRNDLI
ncbi:hypothetical protein M527_25220 [Sphingobium indicum IP26]|nr:hypothetical protein M527_25220 [Sphingobium indicum IP26]